MDINTALVPIVGMAVPIIIVPTVLAMRQARLERELEHAERMKALELGRTLPRDESWWSAPRLSLAFGVVVPISAFFFAWLVGESSASSETAWRVAGIVGLGGVISGVILAVQHLAGSSGHSDHVKPEVDADSFDVVSRRG